MRYNKNQAAVIAGYAGIGKTELAKKYTNVIDLESSPFVYDYTGIENLDKEKLKGLKNRIINNAYPLNYIKAIKESIKKYDFVLIWLNKEKAFPHYMEHGIDFEIIISERDVLNNEYKQRFVNRGNSQVWVENCLNAWDRHYEGSVQTGKKITFLKSGETLESFLTNNPNYLKLTPKSSS